MTQVKHILQDIKAHNESSEDLSLSSYELIPALSLSDIDLSSGESEQLSQIDDQEEQAAMADDEASIPSAGSDTDTDMETDVISSDEANDGADFIDTSNTEAIEHGWLENDGSNHSGPAYDTNAYVNVLVTDDSDVTRSANADDIDISIHSLQTTIGPDSFGPSNHNEPNDLEEGRRDSASSIEFAERSLQVPSLNCAASDESSGPPHTGLVRAMFALNDRLFYKIGPLANLIPMGIILTVATVIPLLTTSMPWLRACYPQANMYCSGVSNITSTVMMSYTATHTITLLPAAHEPTTAASPFGFLIEIPDFGSRKNRCSAEVTAEKDILIRIEGPPLESVVLSVYKKEHQLGFTTFATDDGLLIHLDKRHMYGFVSVAVISTRRSRIDEMFELDFGENFVAQTLDSCLSTLSGAVSRAVIRTKATASSESCMFEVWKHSLRSAQTKLADTAKDVSSRAAPHIADAARRVEMGQKIVMTHAGKMLADSEYHAYDFGLGLRKMQIGSRLMYYRLAQKSTALSEYSAKSRVFLDRKGDELANMKRRASTKPNFAVEALVDQPGIILLWQKLCRGFQAGTAYQ